MTDANGFVDFTAEVLRAQLEATGERMVLLEHPEDLGARRNGRPASIWAWPEIKRLLHFEGVGWGACHQSEFGTETPKPTRLLMRMPGAASLVKLGGSNV